MTCCGRLWRNLGKHLSFAHGEEVVIEERPLTFTLSPPWESITCFCGAPAVGWIYDVMSDGQCIRGLAVCAAHQEEQT